MSEFKWVCFVVWDFSLDKLGWVRGSFSDMDDVSFEPFCSLSAIIVLHVVLIGAKRCLLYVVEDLLHYSTSFSNLIFAFQVPVIRTYSVQFYTQF